MFCSNCGNEVNSNAKFCSSCGTSTAVTSEAQAIETEASPAKRSEIEPQSAGTSRQTVLLSKILGSGSRIFTELYSPLDIGLGQDMAGKSVVTDLTKMQHVLVAGTTGSGKSVAINAMILSLLYKAKPDIVRLILVDSKMSELSVYEGIPHLLSPVVTDMRQAQNALRWCVAEMQRREKLISAFDMLGIKTFNERLIERRNKGNPWTDPFSLTPNDPEPLEEITYIVVFIDELADLMFEDGEEAEEYIPLLAQRGHKSGIHLVLATQRPSVDVITSHIKDSIPTRIALKVSSKIDSRVILGQDGAEALLGKGDMLYQPPNASHPQRIQSAFVSDQEVRSVVGQMKLLGEPDYIGGILDDEPWTTSGDVCGDDFSDIDPLYEVAVNIMLKKGSINISTLQHQLSIGYNRAARLIEDMELAGQLAPPVE